MGKFPACSIREFFQANTELFGSLQGSIFFLETTLNSSAKSIQSVWFRSISRPEAWTLLTAG
jgi:hypothetical protein